MKIDGIHTRVAWESGIFDESFDWTLFPIPDILNPPDYSAPSPAGAYSQDSLGEPVSSVEGEIARMAISVPKGTFSEGHPFPPVLKKLIRSLKGCKFEFVVHTEESLSLTDFLNKINEDEIDKKGAITYRIIKTIFQNSIWIQDPFLVLKNDGSMEGKESGEATPGKKNVETSPKLVNGILFTRYDDESLAKTISGPSSKRCAVWNSFLYFEGGNILVTKDFILLGKDYVNRNRYREEIGDEQAVLENFKRLFQGKPVAPNNGKDKKVLSVGTKSKIPRPSRNQNVQKSGIEIACWGQFQPAFHIDLNTSPTGIMRDGKEVLLVGCMKTAYELLYSAPTCKELDYFRAIYLVQQIYTEEYIDCLNTNFIVERIPIFPALYHGSEKGLDLHVHHFLSYNNCILQSKKVQDGEKRTVLIPQYYENSNCGSIDHFNEICRVLDKAAKQKWLSLGFEVTTISGMLPFARVGGALHCMTKVLERK